ncbi:MAG: cobyric acid synthase [Acidimicrobiia bacterium]
MKGALMVCGTGSDAGKSSLVAGLCRSLHRRGVRVAPFKAQNMALNSYVTAGGHEIGRAQAAQALAAGTVPAVDMNPILLKPTGERTSQVVVLGRPTGELDAARYHTAKTGLRDVVLSSLGRLRSDFDVVVMEGAGSPAEINLLDADLANLWLAGASGAPAVMVGDIERGGVFASLYGTVAILPDDLAGRIKGFVINKFRGDPELLAPGLDALTARTGIPTLGVVPWTAGLDLDAEDSLALPGPNLSAPAADEVLDVAVLRLPRISNFTDFDALAAEADVTVRFVDRPGALGRPDLAVIPGTKATVADLAWLRERGLPDALRGCLAAGGTVLGICGGYQMLGQWIDDDVESGQGKVPGLGCLPVHTTFEATKVTRQRRGRAGDQAVSGYQIHHGRTSPVTKPWIHLDDNEGDGAVGAGGAVVGTTLHGLFESDGFRAAFLAEVAQRRGKTRRPSGLSFDAMRQRRFERLADLVDTHLDTDAIDALIAQATPP